MVAGDQNDLIWMRPESRPVGRPAERSRAEITTAAILLADQEGLEPVSMRRVAAALGTGAASLYRYVSTRDDLLDLMVDAVAAEYALPPPTGDWLADLVDVGRQACAIMRGHPWLPAIATTRPAIGPNALNLVEHILDVLAGHPADGHTKLEAIAMLNAVAAAYMQNELAQRGDGQTLHQAQLAQARYLQHVAGQGRHPRLADALAAAAAENNDQHRFDAILARIMAGILRVE